MPDTLTQLSAFITHHERSNPAISAWSVGMQIHHALLATSRICEALIGSEPGAKQQSFSLLRSVILLFGKIPRGRGKAPDPSIPSTTVTQEELDTLLKSARTLLKDAEQTFPLSWWEHVVFGVMKRDTAIKFIHTHNKHHLSIISDILST